MKYLDRYNSIMSRYRSGEFGDAVMSMHDILESANEPDLLSKMDLSEVQCLINTASGITKSMFNIIKQKTTKSIMTMVKLEDELRQFSIDSYRGSPDASDEDLACNLNLLVRYCDAEELPNDTEAMLCPVDDLEYLGVIKVQKDCGRSSFSFRHELIHYFRDVKVGNRVTHECARKMKGKTPNDDEQDVNYLTAASIMPMGDISSRLDEFEKATTRQAEATLLSDLSDLYEQDIDAVLRRFIEVRSLVDYANLSSMK